MKHFRWSLSLICKLIYCLTPAFCLVLSATVSLCHTVLRPSCRLPDTNKWARKGKARASSKINTKSGVTVTTGGSPRRAAQSIGGLRAFPISIFKLNLPLLILIPSLALDSSARIIIPCHKEDSGDVIKNPGTAATRHRQSNSEPVYMRVYAGVMETAATAGVFPCQTEKVKWFRWQSEECFLSEKVWEWEKEEASDLWKADVISEKVDEKILTFITITLTLPRRKAKRRREHLSLKGLYSSSWDFSMSFFFSRCHAYHWLSVSVSSWIRDDACWIGC